MNGQEYLEILERGVPAWNKWRSDHPEKVPYLSHTNLNGASLFNVDFSGTRLIKADLTGATLIGAELSGAILFDTALIGADLAGANLSGARADGAKLSSAILLTTNLTGAHLENTDLTNADLSGANLLNAELVNADLRHAHLTRTNFSSTDLTGADFTKAITRSTVFTDLDLRNVVGLESVVHAGPSEVSVSTIFRSGGQIPEIFLRGCGLPDSFIVQIPALITAMQPIQFYSCFISYSSKDEELAQRLYADLQSKGVRCWFAPEALKIGDRFRQRIDEVIRVYDRLLLILSEYSVTSSWVEKEVETAMESEEEQKRTILFPVRLDDSVMEIKTGWPADVRRTRHIGDFRRWKEHDEYQKAFARLLNDLKASA